MQKMVFFSESVNMGNPRIIRCYQCAGSLDIDCLFFPIELEHARLGNCAHNKFFLTSDHGTTIPHETIRRQFSTGHTNALIKQLIRTSGLFAGLTGSLQYDKCGSDNGAEEIACVACMDKAPRILLLPCKHLTFCYGCYEKEKRISRGRSTLRGERAPEIKCPVCRTRVDYSTDVYLPHTKECPI